MNQGVGNESSHTPLAGSLRMWPQEQSRPPTMALRLAPSAPGETSGSHRPQAVPGPMSKETHKDPQILPAPPTFLPSDTP